MSAVAFNQPEQRVYPRVVINGEIKYKLSEDQPFNDAMMINISQSGLLISLDQQLDTDTRLTLLMESGKDDQSPIEIIAEVIRVADNNSDYAYDYGCTIVDVKDL